MKPRIKLLFLTIAGLVQLAQGASDSIKEFILDEHTVVTIPVSLDRVTTISFPGPISSIDAAQVTMDTKSPASFQIAHTKGATFFSVRALGRKVATNLNLRWNKKTYVLELVESPSPFYSVIFNPPPEPVGMPDPVHVTPSRLLALLDKAKGYPLLKAHHPEAVAQVEYRNFIKQPKVMDYQSYEIALEEVFRFNPEDTLIFRLKLRNKSDQSLVYAPDGFSLRVGDRTYFASISDAGGVIPPKSEMPAYFAVTGTPNAGRNELSVKNDFIVVLQAVAANENPLSDKPATENHPE
jgi:hypothetical protein